MGRTVASTGGTEGCTEGEHLRPTMLVSPAQTRWANRSPRLHLLPGDSRGRRSTRTTAVVGPMAGDAPSRGRPDHRTGEEDLVLSYTLCRGFIEDVFLAGDFAVCSAVAFFTALAGSSWTSVSLLPRAARALFTDCCSAAIRSTSWPGRAAGSGLSDSREKVQSSRSLWSGQRRRTTVTTACRVVPATTSTTTSPLTGV